MTTRRLATLGTWLGALVMLGGVALWTSRADDKYPVSHYVKFRDGSGLPIGSSVRIAGLPVGRVHGLAIEGPYARIELRVERGLALAPTTVATKRADSALADNYVSLVPGRSEPGAPPLADGSEITLAIEGQSTDRTLRDLDVAIERAKDGLGLAQLFMESAREKVNGPFLRKVEQFEAWLASPALVDGLHDAQASLNTFNEWTLALVLQNDVQQFDRRLINAIVTLDEFRRQVREATQTVVTKATEFRTDIDRVDPFIADVAAAVAPYRSDAPKKGTLAKLIHEQELADTLHDASRGGASFLRFFQNLKFLVRLQSQYHWRADAGEVTAGAEFWNRPDRFLVAEVVGGLGGRPNTRITYSPAANAWLRTTTIDDDFRFTLQFGKAVGPVRLRLGLKQSRIGAGIDFVTWRRALAMSADVFDRGFHRVPTVRVSAGLRVMPSILLYGGVTEALNAPRALLVQTNPDERPDLFTTFHVGRDYFVGAAAIFRDDDLRKMLRIFGGVISVIL